MTSITIEHINACNEFIESFTTSNIRWAILFAEMQSGKTFAFLLTACEMFRQNMIKKIVIFSGCAELILKNQLNDNITKDKEFYNKYKMYLRNKRAFETEEALDDFIADIKANINIVWGSSELKKYKNHTNNTLYIWEESHYAQSVNNCPSAFLNAAGIAGNGDELLLKRKNNYIISVSATPFSELCDNHKIPNKKVVYLKPGTGYNSVKKMLDEKRIVFYDNVSDGLITALHNHSTNSPKYAIIRVGTKCADIMKILSDNGWDFIEYDCDTTNKDAQTCEENKEIVKNMNNAPEKNTAILIKGFFRMGANIKKTHVSFMMETADSSKTDTLLQSLLGRACGYGDGSNSVYVYLSRSYEVSGEIIRYIEGIDECKRTGELCMHIQNARNLCGTYTKRETTPTIPFMIKDITINSDRDCSRGNESKNIQKQVIEKLKNGEYMLGKTHRAQADEIITQLLENGRTVQTHDMCKINEKTINQWKDLFNTKANRLLFDTQSEVPEDLHSTGMKVDKLVIGLFVYKNAVGNIPAGTVIIYGDTLCENPYFTNETLPDTTGCEVFAVGAIAKETMNGCVLHGLSRETSTNEKQMKKELTDIIKVYKAQSKKSSTELANCLKSYYDAETETYHEIILHKTVEKSMIKAGKIYKAIEKLGFTLVLVERNTYETNPDIVSYESISWIPINK